MMRLLKIISSLILILLLTFIGLLTFIDPNHYKTDIVAAVQKSINQPFAIDGDIKWHLWPSFGLLLQGVQIGHTEQLLQMKDMNIEVKLLPLLRQQIDMNVKDIAIFWHHDGLKDVNAKVENINVQVTGLTHASQQISIDSVHIDHFVADKIYFDLLAMLSSLTTSDIIIHKFTMDEFVLHNMVFSSLITQIDIHHNIATLKPFHAKLFAGEVNGQMTLNMQTTKPQAVIDAHIIKANLDDLLKYNKPDNEITGTVDMDLHINADGLDSLIMTSHAKGKADVHIENCVYHGTALASTLGETMLSVNNLQDAAALAVDTVTLSSAMIAQNESGNKITGSMDIHQGSVDAIDLLINDQFPIKRYGVIDWAHDLIALCFDFHKKSAEEAQ